MPNQVIEPGLYRMDDAQYHASPGISNSLLSRFERSPAHLKEYLSNPPEPTPAMEKGSALHCLVLEPELFDQRYAVLPPDAPRKPSVTQLNAKNPSEASLDAIEWWSRWDAIAVGKIVLTRDQADAYKATGERIRSHPELERLLSGGISEAAVFANDPETGVLCRCKIDYMVEVDGRLVLIDLKSTSDARPREFQRSAYNYGYFRQAAYYLDICKWAGLAVEEPFIIPAFEPDPPNCVKIFEISGQTLDRGRAAYRGLLNRYAECLAADEWPGYDTDITPLMYPSWATE